jgi:hypothetical protein
MSTFEISILLLLVIVVCVSLSICVLLNASVQNQSRIWSNSHDILQQLKHMNDQIFKQEHNDDMRIATLERTVRDIRDETQDYTRKANHYFTEQRKSFIKLETSSELSSSVLNDVLKELYRM